MEKRCETKFFLSLLQILIFAIFFAEVNLEYVSGQNTTLIECTEPWKVTFSGETVRFDVRIRNFGSNFSTYFLYLGSPALPTNWTADFYAGTRKVMAIGIGGGQSFDLDLIVTVPHNTILGDYSFRLHANGSSTNASRLFTITVEEMLRKISFDFPFISKSILTGQSVSFPIKILNEGENTEEVFLAAEIMPEMLVWDISFSDDQLTINSKESFWITLDIVPPGVVSAGTYSFEVIATTEDGELEVKASLSIEVVADYLLEITGIQPFNPEVATGEKIQISVTVRNIGQSPLTKIRIVVESSTISNMFALPGEVLVLEPFESSSFNIRVSPNTDLTTGDYVVEIQAFSAETQSSKRTLFVSIVSSIPWFYIWIPSTVAVTAIAIAVLQRLIGKYGIRIRRKK